MPDWVDKAYNLKNMTTTDKILDILESMTTGSDAMLRTVLYESGFGANVRLDRLPDPAAILYMMQSWTLDTDTMFKHPEVDVEIFFCKRCDLAAKGEKIKETMDEIEPIVDEFISLLLSDKTVAVTEIKAQTAYGRFDCNVCGYSLQFKVKDRQGRCL